MPQSAYIHIPFCKSKCFYCAFMSVANTDYIPAYLESLKKEIKSYYKNEPLKTLYFGGGTPSLLKSEHISEIIQMFNFETMPEITVEVNPESAHPDFLNGIFSAGANRLSIGVQSFDEKILKSIGRIHTPKQAKDTVVNAFSAGFSNVSTDFIYGLPFQTQDKFLDDLAAAIETGVQHISLYGLKIEEGTPFYKNPPVNIADEDLQADMYSAAVNLLCENGFEHYEISNFAKNKKYSEHNMNYWNCEEYYGFGAAAHGYLNGARYANFASISKYINSPLEKEFLKNLTPKDMENEAIFLGLRRGTGINFIDFKNRYKTDFLEKYSVILEKYKDFFVITDTNCAFTTEGFLVSNSILADFIEL